MRNGSRTTWERAAAASRGRPRRRRLAILLGCVAALILSAPPAANAGQAPPSKGQQGLKRLWSEYPLNPAPTTTPRPKTTATRPPTPAAHPPPRPRPEPRAGGGSSSAAPALIGAALALAAAIVAVTVVVARRRGGSMARIVRRLLRPQPGRASPAAGQPTGSETTVERLQSYHVERSSEMHREQQGDPAVASPAET